MRPEKNGKKPKSSKAQGVPAEKKIPVKGLEILKQAGFKFLTGTVTQAPGDQN